jgi:DNA modification methylase
MFERYKIYGEDEEIFERNLKESIKKHELKLKEIKKDSKIKLKITMTDENKAGVRRYRTITAKVVGLYENYIRVEYKNKQGIIISECFNRVDLVRNRRIKWNIVQ